MPSGNCQPCPGQSRTGLKRCWYRLRGDGLDQLRPVVAYRVDASADRMRDHQVRGIRLEHGTRLGHRSLEPRLVVLTMQDGGHASRMVAAIVNVRHQLV